MKINVKISSAANGDVFALILLGSLNRELFGINIKIFRKFMFFDLEFPLLGIYLKDTFRRREFINTHVFYVAKQCCNFPTIGGGWLLGSCIPW